MGKHEQQLPQQQNQTRTRRASSSLFCERCSMAVSRICGFKCVVVLILSLAAFVSAVLWCFPYHRRPLGFEAKDSVKESATVQAYFKLPKPVSLLVPQIRRLEYDIYGEIGLPYTKVCILSMNESDQSNITNVVFGVVSEPANVPLSRVTSSVLRSSLIELFLQESNLTLTNSTFGQPSSFEVLKFPGGITIIPEQSIGIWLVPQILFNFTLDNSIEDVVSKFVELKKQLKLGLRLRPYENVYIQVTNKNGSTKDPPITVQASILSDLGPILPPRLKQLAQIIKGSPPAKNLGLDNSVFGKVNQISLSSYLDDSINSNSPTPSPAPSPLQDDYTQPYIPSPSYSPAPSPYPYGEPLVADSPYDSPPPLPNGFCEGEISPESSLESYPPALPPARSSGLHIVSYGSHSEQKVSVFTPPGAVLPVSSSSSRTVWSDKQIRWLCFLFLTTYNLISWSHR